MRIARVRIRNFRSIKSLDLEFGQFNALVGANNIGKSNILLALYRLLGGRWLSVSSFSEEDVYRQDPDAEVIIEIDLDPPYTYQATRQAQPVDIPTIGVKFTRYKIGAQKGERRLEKYCHDARGELPGYQARPPQRGRRPEFDRVTSIPQEVLDALPMVFIGMRRELSDQLPGARYSLLRQLLEDVDKDFRSNENRITVVDDDGREVTKPRAEEFDELMAGAMALLRTEEFVRLEESIKRNALDQLGFDPEQDTDKLDFYFSPFTSMDFYKSLRLTAREGDFEIDATQLGGGFQNSIVIAILRAYEERRKRGGIFLIEEPEMFLHPQMQRYLYKTLRTIGEANQLIYTTHSPHFVTIPEFDEVILVSKDDEGTRITRSALPATVGLKEKLRKEFDPERNELFFARRLILVEGDTEKLALPEFARKLEFDLDKEGVTIVEVGGKRNLRSFAEIALSYEIPTAVVYDRDSSDFRNDREGEEAYNQSLEDLVEGRDERACFVSCLDAKYEDEIRRFLGDDKYQLLCQAYPGHSKPVRQRLIASDPRSEVPPFVVDVFAWALD